MKKTAILILIILTMIANFTNAFATDTSSQDMVTVMSSLDIMSGYPDGSLHLSDKLTRAQFSKVIINASEYRNSVSAKSTTSPFKDVQYSNWSAPYISVAVSNGLIKGYPDASFKPDNNVTLEEAVTVALSAMGYTSEDFGSSWPTGQLSLANSIGLLKNTTAKVGEEITRQDAMQLVYNMLNGNTESGKSYVSTMGYNLSEDVVLIATNEEDSTVVSGNVYTTSGTYKMLNKLNTSTIGKIGSAVLNSSNELICFIPEEQIIETYTAYAAIESDIIVSSTGGYTEALGLNEATTVYYNGSKSTLKNVASNIDVGDIVKVSKSSSGDINFVVISGNKLKGPIIAENSNWYGLFDTDDSNITVMRDGSKSTMSDINTYDVLYYSESLNTLWAYNDKITGVYESASPNKDHPSSITVSGTEYTLETATAFNKVSSQGTFEIGDSVTLLLGKDDNIADVISLAQSKVSVTGYLIDSGTKEITSSTGYDYNVYYVKAVNSEGNILEYESFKDYSSYINSVVTIKFSNGLATLSKVSSKNISGTFDWDDKSIGSYSVAKDINIIDVGTVDSSDESQYVITYPQRIDNVKISSSNILYYSKNSNGEINNLILKNVTGDTMKYGIVTDAEVAEGSTSTSSTYTCDVNGKEMTLSMKNGSYTNVNSGQPAAFVIDDNSVASIKALSKISEKIIEVNEISIKTSTGESYALYSNAVVYLKNYSGYRIIPLSDITEDDNYNLEAYYDKSESSGGRIRIIIATEK